ncbi:multiple sugar transport system permease protein [Paenibacillus rhizosphaerae]|uniref:Multiple sugar transport system permease protein n=1 Tax=Paenibacillus rhizosphaerae TaxID=297318 RepID=A0A839TF29_9BACL|nr:carbohydrate ABC transporter permease [Paenibacillus rhizosphaerae]MBB3125395.1 multiple sugar transport system permease protein [Paenibacillus rhizosphaerae]
MKSNRAPWYFYVIIIIGSVMMVFPFLDMIFSSFKSASEYALLKYRLLPEHFIFSNYRMAIEELQLLLLFKNSLIRSVSITLVVLITSSLAGYVLAKLRFPGKQVIFSFILSTMMFPAFLFFIPNYFITVHFPLVGGNDILGQGGEGGLAASMLGLIVPFSVSGFGIFLMRQFMISIEDAYLEAARIDGAKELRIFAQIVVPMTAPALATLAIFEFINSWNEFIWALLMNSVNSNLATLPVGIQMLKSAIDPTLTQPLVMAGLVIATIPILLLFIFLQKYYVRGMMNTGLK